VRSVAKALDNRQFALLQTDKGLDKVTTFELSEDNNTIQVIRLKKLQCMRTNLVIKWEALLDSLTLLLTWSASHFVPLSGTAYDNLI
jgi:hypothetical protein